MLQTETNPRLINFQATPMGIAAIGVLKNGQEITIRCLQSREGSIYRNFLKSLPSALFRKRFHGFVNRDAAIDRAVGSFEDNDCRVVGAFHAKSGLLGVAELFAAPNREHIEVAFVTSRPGIGIGELLTQTVFHSCASHLCGRECPLGNGPLSIFVDKGENKEMMKLIQRHPEKDDEYGFRLIERCGSEVSYGISKRAAPAPHPTG